MGLTVHYGLEMPNAKVIDAHKAIDQLRNAALDLPFERVSEIKVFRGQECRFEREDSDSSWGWFKIQAAQYTKGRYSVEVAPDYIVGFSVSPGEGCEPANFGLALYPKHTTFRDGTIPTELTGWSWDSFCKTQYASAPEAGGLENFLKCHLSLIALLDRAASLGILSHINDEGEFWEKRSTYDLTKEIGEWDDMIHSIGKSLTEAGWEI